MCGITGFHLTESVPPIESFIAAFREAEKRGRDGFGLCIIHPQTNDNNYFKCLYKQTPFSKSVDEVYKFLKENIKLNDIILFSARNAPETEKMNYDKKYFLQPIKYKDIFYVHNGAFSDTLVKQFDDIDFDSEVFGRIYHQNHKNMKNTVEALTGGWSIIAFDIKTKMLYGISSFLPLAQGYAKGMGYVLHSTRDGVSAALSEFTKCQIKFTRTWENFYVDDRPPYSIIRVDIDSQLLTEENYSIKFKHPTWKQDKPYEKDTKYIVLASGGIDSTTTLAYLKHINMDVTALHIKYGQKSQDAEELAVKNICKKIDVDLKIVDISSIYKKLSINEKPTSMLINKNINIDTAGDNLKTTNAWVPVRNLLFMSLASIYAEELIYNNKYSNIFIAGGYPNIDEESFYPDNSSRFVEKFEELLRFASLAGANQKIRWVNIFENLTKKEELILLKYIGMEELFNMTVSCDNAKIENGKIYQCSYKGKPACGSGLLSSWAAEIVGIKDKRNYYEVAFKPDIMESRWNSENIDNIRKYLPPIEEIKKLIT